MELEQVQARIKIVGVGGGGGNAVANMITQGLDGVEFLVVNTDAQALEASPSKDRIQVGGNVTRGLGAGADPEVGRRAAEEDVARIRGALEGVDMVFVTAGMGGGTGTGAAPVVARVARECGALTVGVVTKPFPFEGRRRSVHAEQGLAELRDAVDTVIAIPNEKLILTAGPDMRISEAFRYADSVLYEAVRGITDVITDVGYINVDFADVRTVMAEMGMALMGNGVAEGEDRAIKAAEAAISSPLLENVDIGGAKGVLINVSGGEDLTLFEVNQACTIVQDAAHPDATIIFGQVVEPGLEGAIRVTVIATGVGIDEGGDRGRATRPMVLDGGRSEPRFADPVEEPQAQPRHVAVAQDRKRAAN